MVTQKIVTRLSNDVLPPVRMVSGDVGREIQLEIYANDESLAPIDLETYSAKITIIKPDKTFVIQDFDNDKVELPEQAGAVTGHGYYQIKIYTAGDHQIYTGQGPFIVDDDILSDEMIESVAEVNGYEFPDDFLTDADLREYVTKYELEDALAGIIDDDTIDLGSTWSSAKISESLSSVTKTATGNTIEFSDGADAPLVKCVTQITGYQSGSGTPSPDNIRPIVAYSTGVIEVSDGDGNVTTHTTTYPSAIYRGSEDVVNGTATTEWIKVVFDGSSDEGWTIASSDPTAFFFCSRADVPTPNWSDILCDSFKTVKTASERAIEGTIWIVYQQIHIHATSAIAPSGVTREGLEEFKTWLSNNPIEVAYPVKTPTTSSVTPTNLPIKSLSGYNHIESSTGDMEVEYIPQTYDAIMEATKLDNMKVYSTAEQVVGKWIDGRDVYEKTIVSEFTNHAENYTLDLSQMGGNAILPIDISPAVCIFTEGGVTYKQIVQPAATNRHINSISVYHGGATADTFKGYVTVRYIYL